MEFNFTQNEDSKDPIKAFGRNVTDMATRNELDPVIGRDDEIRRIIRILSRKTKNNPVLVGEPGVGKTAVVEGLALKILAGNVPENLKNKEIVEIDMGSIIAGASFQGQFEKRIKELLKKVEESNGEIILFIDEIHTIVGTGKNGQGGLDAAQMFKPLLARGKVRIIGATTLDEHKKYIEQDAALERRLQKVIIDEPSQEETITILRGIKDKLENYHKVKIHDSALVSAVHLSSRYISDRFLPDKAIDLVDEAAAGIQTEMNSKPEELERAEQKLAMLKMEKAALSNEKDSQSIVRLKEIEEDILRINTNYESLTQEWQEEKKKVEVIVELKEKIDFTKTQLNRFQTEGEYEKASILMYKELPELESKLEKLEKQFQNRENSLIKENVTEKEIADIVSKWTQIPISKLLKNEKEKLLSLNHILGMRVKGQQEAIEKVADAILRSKADINDPNRPIGSFIFMGPTGVGKTEVAKALASELFDSEKSMIRIDMSEYMEEHSVARLIGSPPGYVGYEEGGQLTEAVRRNPYSIILFDEIEKANRKVLDILLQILDDGQLTDGRGKLTNFKNCIIIMTTNIGSLEILEGEKNASSILKKHLKPELINRIDEIITFNALNENIIRQITQNEISYLANRLKSKNILIDFDKSVIDKVAKDGFEPAFGARPIKRYIQHFIESPLAKEIIKGNIKEETPYIGKVLEEKIIFEKQILN